MYEEVTKQIEEKSLSLKDIERLLMEISWLDEPELIRKLLEYKSKPEHIIQETRKAEAEIKAEWKTEKLPDGSLRLASYKGNDTIVTVPEKIGKNAVAELGSYVFSVTQPRIKKDVRERRARIREIRMSDTVKSIGEGAFAECESLEKVVLSHSITEIPARAFLKCSKLTDVELHQGIISIGYAAFLGCESLEQVVLPECLKQFSVHGKQDKWWEDENDANTFQNCVNLKKVVLPESITELPSWIFDGCINLTDISIPSHLKTIERGAFRDCEKITELHVPRSVKSIRADSGYSAAFWGCKKLTLYVPSGSYAEEYAQKAKIGPDNSLKYEIEE